MRIHYETNEAEALGPQGPEVSIKSMILSYKDDIDHKIWVSSSSYNRLLC